jgi:hypothetical protein
MTSTRTVPTEQPTRWETLRYWVRRLWMMEVWGYLSILRFVLRRPKVPRGAEAFTYHQPVLPLLLVFIVVSAIELVVVDVLVRRWESVRLTLLVLGVWGLVWMFGLLFSFLTRPHAVGPDGIRLRSGAELDLPLRWEEVEAVTRRKRTAQDKQPVFTVDADGTRTLHLHVQEQTNVRIALRSPVTARLQRSEHAASSIDVWVDQPEAFVDAARRHSAKAV